MRLIALLLLIFLSSGGAVAHTNISTNDDLIIQVNDSSSEVYAIFIDDVPLILIASAQGGFEYREYYTNGTITNTVNETGYVEYASKFGESGGAISSGSLKVTTT